MKKENINYIIQLILFPGICVLGLLASLIMKTIKMMHLFFAISTFSRANFALFGNVYGKGHWYSKKECLIDALIFSVIGIIGEIELILHLHP